LGPTIRDDEIRTCLDKHNVAYDHVADDDELLQRMAGWLANEKIIGWAHDRMEFGPRALGCRSILGDPRSPRMQSTMNLKIKCRESFRPFAPSVLREHVGEYF